MAHYKGAASEGNRAVNLMKKREKAKEELERMKMKISEARNLKKSVFQIMYFCYSKVCLFRAIFHCRSML